MLYRDALHIIKAVNITISCEYDDDQMIYVTYYSTVRCDYT
jgi:hypothetical protein